MLVIYITILLVVAESLNYVSTISMLPFFTFGILYRYYQSILEKYIVITSLLCFGCYVVLFSIFDSVDYNIYLHPFSWTMGVKSLLIRCTIGVTGSLTIISFIKLFSVKCFNNKYFNGLAQIGSMTLGIYCVQVILAEGAFKSLAPFVERLIPYECNIKLFVYDMIITPFASILVVTFCFLLINLIRKNKIARLILLGEK